MDIVKLENGKSLIRVPENIRYMNDWKEFDFDLFHGPYIIDKQIPGCGFQSIVLLQEIILYYVLLVRFF